MQSALDAHGREAEAVATLSWTLFIGGVAIFALVMVLAALAVWKRPHWLGGRAMIIAGGVVFPAVTVSALLVFGLIVAREVNSIDRRAALAVEVIAEQFWWRIHYLADDGSRIASANEIRLPVGVPVELRIMTADVLHSFWVPALAGKLDAIPGRVNRLYVEATDAGVYRGQCAEYCGAQHASMALFVVAMPEEGFREWLAKERGPARDPVTDLAARGRAVFLDSGCGLCHAVRGTAARGEVGPDLTHFGSRHSVAAGVYPRNLGTIAGWIAGSQHLKPGNRMPSFGGFSGDDLLAVATYLEGLQ